MIAGLSTAFAHLPGGREHPPDQVIDRALRAGAAGLMLHSGLSPAAFDGLARLLLPRAAELPVWALESPCPATRASLADLAAADRDEAEAALRAAEATVERAGDLAAKTVALQLGEVAVLRRDWPQVRRSFLRATLNDQDRERLRVLRAKQVVPHLDAARRALEHLARFAERAGVTLGIRNPPRHLGLPSPGELVVLLGELSGAPIVPLLDLPAAHLDEAMGLRQVAEVVAAWSASPIALLADACGPVLGLPPGQGEIDVPAFAGALSAGTRAIFSPWSGLSADEVVAGLRAVGGLTTKS